MGNRQFVVVEMGERWLRAVAGRVNGGIVHVKRVLIERVPPGLLCGDASAYGRWAGERLKATRFPEGTALIALGRREAGLKRLALPMSSGADLAGMVRMQLQRDLPMEAGSAVVDYLVVREDGTQQQVLTAVVAAMVILQRQQAAEAAGLKLGRVMLRAEGAVRLASSVEARAEEEGKGVLVVDVTGETVEFSVGINGRLWFSRSAELGRDEEVSARAGAVMMEAKRTWTSFRASEDAVEIGRVIVLGEGGVARRVSAALSELVQAGVEVMDSHPNVTGHAEDMEEVWPLAGLLLEQRAGKLGLDLLHPKKAPNLGEVRRRRGILAAGVALVVIAAGWTYFSRSYQATVRQADALERRINEVSTGYLKSLRGQYKLDHLQRWQSASEDWLERIMNLQATCPPTEQLVLDSWTGTLGWRDVEFDRKGKTWVWGYDILVELDGEARERAIADGFRETLVKSAEYKTTTTGADGKGGRRLPYGFTYRLEARGGGEKGSGASSGQKKDSPDEKGGRS